MIIVDKFIGNINFKQIIELNLMQQEINELNSGQKKWKRVKLSKKTSKEI